MTDDFIASDTEARLEVLPVLGDPVKTHPDGVSFHFDESVKHHRGISVTP